MMKQNAKPTLAQTNPKLAREWHATKNAQLMPKDVALGSNKKTIVILSERHE